MELVRSDVRTIMLAPVDFDFHRMLEDVRIMFARRAEEQALTLAVAAAPDVPQFLCADQGKLRQILVNLIGNALKFTKQGGVHLAVTVSPAGGGVCHRPPVISANSSPVNRSNRAVAASLPIPGNSCLPRRVPRPASCRAGRSRLPQRTGAAAKIQPAIRGLKMSPHAPTFPAAPACRTANPL